MSEIGRTITTPILPIPEMYKDWREWAYAFLRAYQSFSAQDENPATAGGVEGDVPQYAVQVDKYATHVSDPGEFIYLGQAEPGSVTSAAVWRVKRIRVDSDPEIQLLFADGNENFDNIWDNRESLSYG